MGMLTAQVDSGLPNIAGAFSGTPGSNGWYVSPVSFNGAASDAVSGLASFTCTLDGVALGFCNAITIGTDGPHSLVLTARDNAGHTRTLTQNASIDTQGPVLNSFLRGTLGSNNWYTAATLNASASDPSPGSGLSVLEYDLDGSGWTIFPSSGALELRDGKHSIDLRAVDDAGHITSSSKSFWLDTVAPGITLDAAGTTGSNGWYTTNPTLTASAQDDTSGIALLEFSLNTGVWKAYTTPLTLSDGIHSFSLWAQDAAGLVTRMDRTYQVDSRVPQVAGNLSGIPGTNGWYISEVIVSASASDPEPGAGMDNFVYTLDGSAETPYSNPLTLSDGQHTLQLDATDKAGLSYSTKQTIKVDTIPPSLNVETVLSHWVKDDILIKGTAADSGSGLLKVEISTDEGLTWQAVVGTDSWGYSWSTPDSPNGNRQVSVRVFDLAGLSTQHTFHVGVDNHTPAIRLPDSWFQWDTVTLDIWDTHSGLSTASVEITDPESRWRKRVIQLDPDNFPLRFKWDRRFGDGTVAPLGTYDVKVIASDNLHNESTKNASIKILLDILPPGPTATLQSYTRADLTPTPAYTATVIPAPGATRTPLVSAFGFMEPTLPTTPTPGVPAASRATPTQIGVLDWLQSLFVPNAHEELVTTIGALEEFGESTQPVSTNTTPVLWGAAAAAAIGAATSYALDEKRRREETTVRQAVDLARELERDEKKRASRLQEQQENWLKQQAAEEALAHQAQLAVLARRPQIQEMPAWFMAQSSAEERAREKQKAEEKQKAAQMQAALAAAYAAMRQIENEVAPAEPNWWDKTKAFIKSEIVEPLDTHVYKPLIKPVIQAINEAETRFNTWFEKDVNQPYVQPFLERNRQINQREIAWIDEHINQPVIVPIKAKIGDGLSNGMTQFKKEVYQPHIKPALEKRMQDFASGVDRFNKKVYQPYLEPTLAVIDEKIYQPYIQPVVDRNKEFIASELAWINKNIYQPVFEPVVKDIKQHIYQPLAKQISDSWDESGEWVHGALDVVGFLPVIGEWADGVNGVIYLLEGRKAEAVLSGLSMIPLLGNLGTAGKWTLKTAQEVLDTAVEKTAKEFFGESLEKTVAKQVLEAGTEQAEKEVAKHMIVDGFQQAIDLVGVIPGAGNTTTTINSVISLVRGRLVDAATSVISMVPVVGDFATKVKNVVDDSLDRLIAKEVAERQLEKTIGNELLEAGSQTLAREAKEELTEKAVKESGETVAEITKESLEAATKEVVEETGEELAEKVATETVEGITEKTTAEALDEAIVNAANKAYKELREDAFIEKFGEEDSNAQATPKVADRVGEEPAPESPQRVDEAQFAQSLRDQYGDEMVDRFLPFCERYGINPQEVVSRPLAEGQSLIGWGLNIDNPINPVNHSLVDLNLTKAELDNIREESTIRPESKIVVLGYGRGTDKPYYVLSDEVKGCHVSLSNDAWAPFENARANFWVDINAPFIEKGIEERKIFLFNIEYDVITNPRNVERFSLPELRLIEMEENNYVKVSLGKHTALVPEEALDTFEQDLPSSLFGPGE